MWIGTSPNTTLVMPFWRRHCKTPARIQKWRTLCFSVYADVHCCLCVNYTSQTIQLTFSISHGWILITSICLCNVVQIEGGTVPQAGDVSKSPEVLEIKPEETVTGWAALM